MRILSLPRRVKTGFSVYLVILWIAVGNFIPLFAHSGSPIMTPTKVSSTIAIDGTINAAETAWGTAIPVDTLINNCNQFMGSEPAPSVGIFPLNDGLAVFLAFDIPDASAHADDTLFLAFDPNHNGGTTNPEGGATPDRAVELRFNNTGAVDAVPDAKNFTGTGSGWSAEAPGLPAGWNVKYTRITTGTGKWQVEMRLPFTTTVGFTLIYLNRGAGTDCDVNGIPDDFFARYPSTWLLPLIVTLPADLRPPSEWGNLEFGPQPPTVGFQPPTCCGSPDITYSPATQPFAAGMPVTIQARVHNQHASSTANNVNVEIRVHDFGTGGTVISPFPLSAQIPAIAPSGNASTPSVTWPLPPAGLHGCIRAEIKPPTTNQYFIAGGLGLVQHNIDVACIPQTEKKEMKFMAFNPDNQQQEARKIVLAQQVLLPPGFEGLKFDLEQPNRELRAGEAVPVRLTVSASANTPLTEVPTQRIQVPATAGGTAIPPLHERSGTDPVVVKVNPGDRLHFAATGEVDLDGGGPIPAAGPDGRDVSTTAGRRTFLLGGESSSRVGGALIGSFNNFANSFVIGKEGTLTVPNEVKELRLAVNDFDAGYGDNSGNGFAVTVSTLPPLNPVTDQGEVIGRADQGGIVPIAHAEAAAKVTLPQINIVATSTSKVTIGERTYNLLMNHGGVTYQFLVVKSGTEHVMGGGKDGWKFYLWILLLLLLILILILVVRRILRKKQAA